MSKNIENIDRYLKSVVLPEHVSHQHRQQLRREVLGKIERRQTMSERVKSWRYAAVIALIGTGVVVAGAVIGVRYRFVAKDSQRGYLVDSEDGRSRMNITEHHATSPEQAVATAEEIARLKQQGQRELVGVIEIRTNGELDSRLFRWKYNLSDGRTITMGEPDPDAHAPMTLTGERLAEAGRLLQQTSRNTGVFVTTDEGTFRVPEEGDEEKETPTYEQVFQGRTFIFEKHTFTLSDGTQVAWSSGRLPEDRPSRASGAAINEKPLPKDLQEWAALQKHGKGQLIGVDELTANGELDRRVFVYQYLLSDGRTMDMREGDELNFAINSEQRKEWVQLKDASSGEDFGTYEKEVQGRMFVFKRQRFVLSDGTELIWSYGTLKDDQ
jgi:hypothetical protein